MRSVRTVSASSAVCPRLLPAEILSLFLISLQVFQNSVVSTTFPRLCNISFSFQRNTMKSANFEMPVTSFLLSLPLKFWEISSFLISLHPCYSLFLSSSERFPRFLSPSLLLSLPLKFREISSFLISLHPCYSLFLSSSERFPCSLSLSILVTLSLFLSSSERFPCSLSGSILVTLSSSQVPRDFLVSYLHPFYSLFLSSSERFPCSLSLSFLFTLSSSQVPRDSLVPYLSPSFLLSLPLKFHEISLAVTLISCSCSWLHYKCPTNASSS